MGALKNDTLIEVSDLKVDYDGKTVLECPSLSIRPNDFIGVTGPNGGGKTTLVKALLKSIPCQGKVVYSEAVESHGIRRIGYLPQIHETDRTFPIEVLDAVLSGLQAEKGLTGRYTDLDRKKAESLLGRAGIRNLSRKIVGELSGGEFQRAMLCRALISEPVLLILDEPNNFVDHSFQHELYHLLDQLNESMAIVLVSHDPGALSRCVKSVLSVNRSVQWQNMG